MRSLAAVPARALRGAGAAAARAGARRAASSAPAEPLKLSALTAVTGVDGRCVGWRPTAGRHRRRRGRVAPPADPPLQLARAPTLASLHRAATTAPTPPPARSYGRLTSELRPLFSEYALIRHRVIVEVEWLRALAECADIPEVPPLSAAAQAALSDIVGRFDAAAAQKVKDIEATTNHDVKAVEYYLKDAFAASGVAELAAASEFLHFACTSEDVNNLAYALMVRNARAEVMLPTMARVVDAIGGLGEALADAPLMSRTHGQPATPTTMGKELANFAYRLGRQARQFGAVEIAGKFNGAVGNFNAHVVAYPRLGGAGWVGLARRLVERHLGLAYNPYSTQVRAWKRAWCRESGRVWGLGARPGGARTTR
jgi:hypothetical protein